MTADRAESMRQARRIDSDRKRHLVLAATDAQLGAGRHPTIAGIARAAGVGRKFIYDHPDLKADIELKAVQATSRQAHDITSAARVTGASLRADLENARAQNHRLSKQIKALENRLSKAEGARLVADELLPQSVLEELADQQLARRVAELDQQLFEAREDLRRTTEELEAARTINRELMQQANRPQPHDPRQRPTRAARQPTQQEP
jgi:DNA-binding transcriptional ArsR family regulator